MFPPDTCTLSEDFSASKFHDIFVTKQQMKFAEPCKYLYQLQRLKCNGTETLITIIFFPTRETGVCRQTTPARVGNWTLIVVNQSTWRSTRGPTYLTPAAVGRLAASFWTRTIEECHDLLPDKLHHRQILLVARLRITINFL